MAGRSRRPRLQLSNEEIERLQGLRDSRTAPWREAQRARIILRYHSGESVTAIAKAVGMTRKSVGKWIGKALEMGSGAALKWVVHLACSKPKDLGYAAEVGTRSALARHVREHAPQAGYTSLSRAAKATTAPDLPPRPGRHAAIGRDREYKRLGTCSILAALDLHNGHVTARVERRHRSREFVALLKDLDAHYWRWPVSRVFHPPTP